MPVVDPIPISGGRYYVHPMIAGIMHELPKAGEPMSEVRRKQWLVAFESILRFLYPDQVEREHG